MVRVKFGEIFILVLWVAPVSSNLAQSTCNYHGAFDPRYYQAQYKNDTDQLHGNEALLSHWLRTGVPEGRLGCAGCCGGYADTVPAGEALLKESGEYVALRMHSDSYYNVIVDWSKMDIERIIRPFIEWEIKKLEKNTQIRSTLDGMISYVRDFPGETPAGFIFHMTRCGSTLASKMLNALDDAIVISEPDIVMSILNGNGTPSIKDTILRSAILSLCRPRNGKRYYIKFAMLSSSDMTNVLRAFPNTPWIFIHRNPVEVMVSNIENKAPWIESSYFNHSERRKTMSLEDHLASSLAETFDGVFLHHDPHLVYFLEYSSVKSCMLKVLHHFNHPISDVYQMQKKMMAVTNIHSHTRDRVFESDSNKKDRITDAISEALIRYDIGDETSGMYGKLIQLQMHQAPLSMIMHRLICWCCTLYIPMLFGIQETCLSVCTFDSETRKWI